MTHKSLADGPSITIDATQERVIREAVAIRCRGRLSAEQIGRLCGRSERWARQALRLLGLETRRMKVYGTRTTRRETTP